MHHNCEIGVCAYCLSEAGPFDKAHIFPRSIGGCITTDLVCKKCNNSIGETLESGIPDSLFFAVARERLALAPKERAYSRMLGIEDPVSGAKLKFGKTGLTAKQQEPIEENYFAPIGEMSGTLRRDLAREFNKAWADHVAEKVAEGCEYISLPNGRYLKTVKRSGLFPATFKSKVGMPFPFLAKAVYELLLTFGYPTLDAIVEYKDSTFSLKPEGNSRNRILVYREFLDRVQEFNSDVVRCEVDMYTVDFRPWHRVDFALTSSGVAYVLIGFFGCARYAVSIAKVAENEMTDKDLVNTTVIFPVRGDDIQWCDRPESNPEIWRRYDIVANARWDRFVKAPQ